MNSIGQGGSSFKGEKKSKYMQMKKSEVVTNQKIPKFQRKILKFGNFPKAYTVLNWLSTSRSSQTTNNTSPRIPTGSLFCKPRDTFAPRS
jgi:hypothetical protein